MSRRWVVNASPLILLGKIGRLELLRDLSDELIIPGAVVREVAAKPDGQRAIEQVASFPTAQTEGGIVVPSSVSVWDLGRGESQVLAMAQGAANSRVVLDDLEARRCAQTLGVPVIGTLGVVLRAQHRGLIEAARPVIAALRGAGLYVSDKLIERVLAHLDDGPTR